MGDDTNKMFDDAWIIFFFRLDTLTHLNIFSHLPISITQCIGKTQRQSEQKEYFWCIWLSDMKKDIDKELRNREMEILTRHSEIRQLGTRFRSPRRRSRFYVGQKLWEAS